ncbi:tetratricopeptide repeat protein [Thermoproteota archaeon]
MISEPEWLLINDNFSCPICENMLIFIDQIDEVTLSTDYLFGPNQAPLTIPFTLKLNPSKTFFQLPPDQELLACEDALVHNPQNKDALWHVGLLSVSKKNLNHAASAFERLLKIDPDNINVLEHLSDCYFALGWFDRVIPILKHLRYLGQDTANVRYNLGVTYLHLKKPLIAHYYLVKALALFTESKDIEHVQGIVRKLAGLLKRHSTEKR